MSRLTKEYFDQRLDQRLKEEFVQHTEAILAVVKQGLDESSQRLEKVKATLASLIVKRNLMPLKSV